MPDIPECLNRRFRVLDELVMDLTNGGSCCSSEMECSSETKSDVGIKMLCSFWKILKENPDYNLSQAVQQRMDLETTSHRCSQHQHITCYMAGCQKQDDKTNEDKNKQTMRKLMNIYCGGSQPETSPICCASKSVAPSVGSDVLPLSKVLCNLKEAASFDKKCNERLNDLMLTQKELKNQIEHLEHREKEGTRLLKQADCMWSCMEDTYKKKIAESLERQKDLLKQLKEVETSATKWRKNKKDFEMQMDSINKCQQEIKEKTEQKTNDIKCMDMEIAGFKKRIENNKKDTEAAEKSLGTRKQASDAKIANLAAELSKQQKILAEQNRNKQLKGKEGSKYVKEAREELQKICTVLLERKLKNEDLKAEKEALNVEIGLLRKTRDKCTEKCNNKQESINDEIKSIEKEIADFKIKCIRCHQCTDTNDFRKLCTDCPKCAEERECIIYEDDHCSRDFSMDCVCMSVKQKFLDNVFDNMYTVLERQTKTNAGKYVADVVLNCLKRSRNGKLDDETRKVLQEFVLTAVKKNLTLTIIGGAVKTRCEMDPDTYKQLMLCLRTVKSVRPPKEDKGTAAKKEPCGRWGGSSECNCPKGPKACICSRKAPPPPNDPTPCLPPEKVDAVEITPCRHKKSTACGPDCAMHAVPSRIGLDLASLRPAPCNESSRSSPKNMRTAQCLLGSDSICSSTKGFVFSVPYASDLSSYDETVETTSCHHKTSTACGPDCAMHAVSSRIGQALASLRSAPCNESSRSSPKNMRTAQCLLGSDSICSSTKGFVFSVENSSCRHKKSTACGPDCAMHAVPSRIGPALASLRPAPCNESSCSSPKNLRTAQCFLGSDSVCSSTKGFVFSVPYVPDLSSYNETVEITSCCHKKSTAYGPDCAMHTEPSRIGPDLASLRPDPCNECSCSFPNNMRTAQCLLDSDSICSSTKGFVLPLPYVADLSSYDENVICKCGGSTTKPVCRDIKHLKTAIQQQTDIGTNIDTHHNVSVQDILQEVLTVKKQINKETYAQRLNEIGKLKTVSSTPGNFFYEKTTSEPNMFIKPFDSTTNTLVYSKKFKQQKINDQLLTVDDDMNIDLNNLYIELTYTASGHLAIELDDKVIETIENKLQEDPNICIFAKKTDTGHYILDINTESTTMTRNQKITMKKTLSGNNIFEINKNLLKDIQRIQNKNEYGIQINDRDIMETSKDINTNTAQTINKIGGNDRIFKIKIKDIENNIKKPPAVLHVSPSNNYIVVLDKEYEKYYLQTVNDYIGEGNNECLVELHKTTSNNYMITLSDMGEDSQVTRQNALLVKSPSGYIKILVNGSTFDAIDYAILRKNSSSSIKAYIKLLYNLPNSNKDLHADGSREYNLHHAKSNIDSDLYSKEKLKDQQILVADSSIALKRICSGHYAVILNGNSKKTFVIDLKNYLKVSQGLIPLKKTKSGEIIIMLNYDDKSNIGYGSLKITPSGNISVIVDEKVIQVTSNDSNINNDDFGSKHIIEQINQPVNKSVTTNCNAKPDRSFCNPSKCVCDKLGETQKWLENSTIRDRFRLFQPESYSSTVWKNEKANKGVRQKVCNPKKCANTMKGRNLETCDCSPVMNDSKCKQCYFMVDPICANINQYDALSNDLFEISKLSNITSKDDVAQRDYKKYEDNWDSLSYLPPQLPAFLNGYKYH